MVMGVILAALRSIPAKLWRWGKSMFVVSLEIRSDDEVAFGWMAAWLDSQPSTGRIRRLRLTAAYTKSGARPVLTPGFGWFWIRWGRHLILLYREREEGGDNQGGFSKRTELIKLHTWGRSTEVLRRLVTEAKALVDRHDRGDPVIYIQYYDTWIQLGALRHRDLGSVVLPEQVAQECCADLNRFLLGEQWYHSHGVPWRRGYLLKGLPGTGKTSLVQSLAATVERDLYVINLKASGMTDERFLGMVANIKNGLLLIEEVDLVVPSREAATSADSLTRGVGLSTLLNVLDGAMSREGVAVFMTTNYPDKLDPALVRRGRIDREYVFTYASQWQLEELWRRFYPDQPHRAGDFAALFPKPVAMAEAQEKLVATRDNPDQLWEDVCVAA